MTEEKETPKEDRRFVVLVLMLVTTVFSALLAGLQSDAGIRADEANMQSQYYAVLASAELYREGLQSAFDLETLSIHMRHLQETTVLQYSALQLEGGGDADGAAQLRQQARSTAARAEAARKVALILMDARYAPSQADGIPNLQAYLDDQFKQANELVARQNAESDAYHRWDNKANNYLTILSMLALVFFLLGVAQNSRKLRNFFTVAALVILLACGGGALLVLIS